MLSITALAMKAALTNLLVDLLAEFDDVDALCGEPRLTVQDYYREAVERRIAILGQAVDDG